MSYEFGFCNFVSSVFFFSLPFSMLCKIVLKSTLKSMWVLMYGTIESEVSGPLM